LNNTNPRRIIGQDRMFMQQLLALLIQMEGREAVQREIVTLLEELPINHDLQAAFKTQVQRIPTSGSSEQRRLWC